MANDREQPPQYTRYRARPRLSSGKGEEDLRDGRLTQAPNGAHRGGRHGSGPRLAGGGWRDWRGWTKPKRIALTLVSLVIAWLALSLVLFLISSHFERTPLPADV